MIHNPLPRLDKNPEVYELLLKHSRLRYGDVWEDSVSGHKVGCLNACDANDMDKLVTRPVSLVLNDPPYNIDVLTNEHIDYYIYSLRLSVENCVKHMSNNSALYIWMGGDQNDGFRPIPEFLMMMREFDSLKSRSHITLRNQRGYGTQKNWMAVRQECFYYIKGNPAFKPQYTEIEKKVKGYFKDGVSNDDRGKGRTTRASNVWYDIQQVFYRMVENVSGCYAQKPYKAVERIIHASSEEGEVVFDGYSHSGTTLLASEINNRKCYTMDIDPVFAEITIRRLEHYRETGKLGWQNGNPFPEILLHGLDNES